MKIFLKGVIAGFKKFGDGIVNIVNFILLIPVYFIGVGLTSIIAKLLGKHFLNLKKRGKTNWTKHYLTTGDVESYYRMF